MTITWEVGGSTSDDINAQLLDIYLSTDGGQNFDTQINICPIANDGSYTFTVPDLGTATNARIMLQPIDNIFFDINNSDITINNTTSEAYFNITQNTCEEEKCNDDTYQVSFTYTANGFDENVNLSIIDDAGTGAVLSTNDLSSDTTFNLSINDLSNLEVGVYTIQLQAQSGSIIKNFETPLQIASSSLGTINLITPVNGTTGNSVTDILFSWETVLNAVGYSVEVSTSSTFDVINLQTFVEGTDILFEGYLNENTTYYWRVEAFMSNNCVEYSEYSEIFSFTTTPYCRAGYPGTISEYISNVSIGNIDNDSGDASLLGNDGYDDFRHISTELAKGEIYNFSITINTASPDTDYCNVFIDWNQDGTFDNSEVYSLGSVTNQSAGVLSTEITVPNNAVLGETLMRARIEWNTYPGPCQEDNSTGYGETEDYTINVIDSTLSASEIKGLENDSITVSPNPFKNYLHINHLTTEDHVIFVSFYDITGKQIREIKSSEFKSVNEIDTSELPAGIYFLKIIRERQEQLIYKVVKND